MSHLIHENKVVIEKGEDKTIKLLLWNKSQRVNFDLTAYDYFEFHFRKDDNTTLIKNSVEVAAIAATATVLDVDLVADTAGAAGNVDLVFDGVETIDDVLLAWNAANPLNTISIDTGDGTQVPSASTVSLLGGFDAITHVVKESDEKGILKCILSNDDTNSLMKGKDMPFRVILDSGTHPTGNRISKTFYLLDIIPSSF